MALNSNASDWANSCMEQKSSKVRMEVFMRTDFDFVLFGFQSKLTKNDAFID